MCTLWVRDISQNVPNSQFGQYLTCFQLKENKWFCLKFQYWKQAMGQVSCFEHKTLSVIQMRQSFPSEKWLLKQAISKRELGTLSAWVRDVGYFHLQYKTISQKSHFRLFSFFPGRKHGYGFVIIKELKLWKCYIME